MKPYFWCLFFLILFSSGKQAKAQSVQLENFIIKENLIKNDKIAIIATDADEKPKESVNGTFLFNINGFKQELKFHDGVSVAPQQIEKSTFVYLKHINDSTTTSKLYYVLKKAEGLNPIKISWKILILIPIILVIIASVFKRFILFAIIILIGMFFFNSSNGLSFPTFFETIIDGLKEFIL